MPGIYYQEDKVWQIVAFVRSLRADTEKPSGNAAAGATLFQTKGCAGCHRVGAQGGNLGPNLTTIGGSRSLAHLRQSIVDPEADVSPRYWKARLKDPSGKTVEGFILTEDTYGIRLIDLKQQLHSYDKTGISDFQVDRHSPMPSYNETLTSDQVNDLVTYLSSLRQE